MRISDKWILKSVLLVSGFALTAGAVAASLQEAVSLMEQRQYQRAEPLLRQALKTGEDADASYLLGFLLIETYRYAEAEQQLQAAVGARPDQDHWLMVLAKSQLEQGKNLAADKTLLRAIALKPESAYYHAHAMTAFNTGDLARAESSLRACLDLDPAHQDALFRLGGLLIDRGDHAGGIVYLEKARDLNPANLETAYRLGTAYRAVGQLEAAEELLSTVVEQVPGHVGALHNLSRVLIRLGKREEAASVMEQFSAMSELRDEIDFNALAVRKNPANINGKLLLASLYLQAGRTQEAMTELMAARALAPRDARIYRELSSAYRRLGDVQNAERAQRFADNLGIPQ